MHTDGRQSDPTHSALKSAGAPASQGARPLIVVVGGGFGGLEAAKALGGTRADVVVIDRQNHHCFQPLLYQVATASLSPADVAWPIRGILGRWPNISVFMAEVTGIDLKRRCVRAGPIDVAYDQLVLATGATHSYFGHDDWAPFAPGLKRIEDATDIRRRLLLAFERAEIEDSPEARERLMTIVIVGGGPTGVEMAGAVHELVRVAMPLDFRRIDPRKARIVLVEAGNRLLPALPETLSAYTAATLERMGVEVRTGCTVMACDAMGVETNGGRIESATLVWAAGVVASPAACWLGVEGDRAGRVKVGPDLSVAGHPEIFVVGDTAAVVQDGNPVPGVAAAAKQMGHYVGAVIKARIAGKPAPGPFHYRHQGDLATIGRKAAVAKIGKLELTGFIGWLFWSVIHIYFLIGARNRFVVATTWLGDYLTFQRNARLITLDRSASAVRSEGTARAGAEPSGGAGLPGSEPVAEAPDGERLRSSV
ncbi:NAD(P)/FAD-dependent oxidoreductase [Rhizobiales bacterium Sp-1]|uniref:NADH:ubiquinone reductase (non-electrogenic) n=2 Tax=Segnochrobactrum spirostomi TaxID=2608987 RepID=A0A6A7YA00_9HYPH|nr:NAD(P)/FAD-dependent oxidoreductase [Segnochrobactrum spirostomi]